MSHTNRFVVFTLLLLSTIACGLITRPEINQGIATTIPSQTYKASSNSPSTPVPSLIVAVSDTPTSSGGSGLAIPPKLTLTPGIGATYSDFIARQTEMVSTAFAQMGFSAHLMGFLIFYSNPVGTPLQTWHDVPIMIQATTGQEFQSDIYSYKVAATLDQGTKFYSEKSNSLKWFCTLATGYGGTGANANHSSTFMCNGLTVIVTAFDQDTGHILVVINKAPK